MAEVQKTTLSGELTQRFIEFVVMHAQNAALFLGQIPNPKTGQGEVNLDLARMFIDQLAMIQEKTLFPICRWHMWKLRGNSLKRRCGPRRQKPRRHQRRLSNHRRLRLSHQRRLVPLSPR